MTAPAHDQIRTTFVVENPRVAQDVINGVGDAARIVEIEALATEDGVVDVDDVTQHCEQMFLDTANHRTIDEGAGRRVLHFELDAPGLTTEADFEILVALEDGADVVGLKARTQHRQRAATEQVIHAALTGAEQLLYFTL